MGQHTSRTVHSASLVQEADCFKQKVLMIRPPNAVLNQLSSSSTAGEAGCVNGEANVDKAVTNNLEQQRMPTRAGSAGRMSEVSSPRGESTFTSEHFRLLRSVIVRAGSWDGRSVLAEQWRNVMAENQVVVYFFDESKFLFKDEKIVREKVIKATQDARVASEDALLISASWQLDPEGGEDDGEFDDASKKEETNSLFLIHKKEATADTAATTTSDGVVEMAVDLDAVETEEKTAVSGGTRKTKEDEKPKGPVNFATISAEAGYKAHFNIKSMDDFHRLKCICASLILPQKIARPLYSLLFQLVDACEASEGHIIDSVQWTPLVTTLDDSHDQLGTPSLQMCGILRNKLGRILRTQKTNLNFVCMQLPAATMYIGWACRPHAYVVLLCRHEKTERRASTPPLLTEKNMEYFGMHFYNVINNVSLRRQHEPICE